ncbi:MAG: hypothetical protein QXG03_03075, partial [Halalkalicoccus sp.]
LESDLDLLSRRIDGVRFWERVRFAVHRELLREATGLGRAHSESALRRARARKLAGLLRHSLVGNPFLADPAEIAVINHPRRSRREDGLWWDIYTDPIVERLDSETLTLERPYDHAHKRPARTESIRYLDPVVQGGNLRRKFAPPTVLGREEERELARIERRFSEAFGVEVDIAERVRRDLVTRRCRLGLYRRLFERLDPDLVVLVVSYVLETAIEACHDLDIPVAELQHGVISPTHAGYAYPGGRTKRTFPDYLLTFGEFWGETVELPIPEARVLPVGYPHLDSTAGEYADRPTRERAVVVSQGTVGEDLSRFAVGLARTEGFDPEVVYKLHPGEYDRWREAYPWLVDSPVRVVADADLYELFSESRLQVGVYSTAIYEGLAFALDTYLVDLPGVSQLRPLLDRNAATLVDSPAALVAARERAECDGAGGEPPDPRAFFAPGALERATGTIERLRREGRVFRGL